ncbi:nucleotidyl transferase AbiEii/AbiGii toxin family protein [Proteiniphilum sp. UBA5384]|uniref:nucleotidyl transferase AbiEii/AbiGii toxin family protein n=1 Tax=Proteiniphilum sp. UBA5384 TaxID=1947279 RepID=UPI0025E9F2F1|nr:nucleotidyl transferase AbiEii/AbiGii toxin family protein [Proteiniphilum sp. UBA5384]
MYNYSKTDLERIASGTDFIRDNLEKVFRLCDVLKHLNENPLFVDHLALKGGTAINLIVFNLPRLSVDIDLDFTKECSRDEMMKIRENINQDFLNYMFTQGYALSPNTKSPHSLDSWVFYFQNAGGNKDNLKVEINYSLRNHILPIVGKKVNVEFLQFDSEVKTLSTLELFGSKIKALIERTASRDLYDIQNMLKYNIIYPDEMGKLRKIVLFYLAVGGSDKPSISYDFESIDNLKFTQIRSSLLPVLKKSERFDFESAKVEVKAFLQKLMTFTEEEKSFIENFNNNVYQPELLFEDTEIVERVKNHPMAMWKIRNSK